MTIAPDRELEELDFPTPDVEGPTGTIIDGLVPREMIPELAPALRVRTWLPGDPHEGGLDELLAAVREQTIREVAALAPAPSVVMTRLGPMLLTPAGIVRAGDPFVVDHLGRDWTCYCSPSRRMVLEHHRAARARQLRRMRVLLGLLAVYAVAVLAFLLV